MFLVDGYALIYRAFFAMIARPLTTKRGENTSAVWGITNFLLRLYENYHPEYVGWVHDRGVSFRQEQYPEYKATREKLGEEMQQDFDRSLERVCQILDAFHIPVIAINGYEADDVVATLAQRAATSGLQAVIVSGDKDFYQLVGPGIALLNPGRGPGGGRRAVGRSSNASERLACATGASWIFSRSSAIPPTTSPACEASGQDRIAAARNVRRSRYHSRARAGNTRQTSARGSPAAGR